LRGRTAAALLVAAALVALVAFATTGFGAGTSGPEKVKRSGARVVRVHFSAAAKAAHHHPPRTLYGSAAATIPLGNHTISLGRCPNGTHIVNGSVAALHGEQAKYLTIHGFGVATPKTWFVDVGNTSQVEASPGFPVKAAAFIVCERD
jgi:hypothetical protein